MSKKIRETTKSEIESLLDNSVFTKYAFNIEYNNSEQAIFKVVFTSTPVYSFEVTYSPQMSRSYVGKKDLVYHVKCSPGKYFNEVSIVEFKTFEEVLSHIGIWTTRIFNELREGKVSLSHFQNTIDELKRDFEERIRNNEGNDKGEYFSGEQVDEYKNKLDDILAKMRELKGELELNKSELEKVKLEFDKLKECIEILPRETWLRSAGNKMIDLMTSFAKSEIGQKMISSSVKGFLDI
ncbi:hypothetical protein [Roseivirga pacifica]|uniref:hypothetical protein n=1 Tax=Roseivirga pacifica TaxID=1267423 RepID=UPI00227CF190|nr:hypothetical protein [Roseivirga pacifica]